jgi:hypothetical protein
LADPVLVVVLEVVPVALAETSGTGPEHVPPHVSVVAMHGGGGSTVTETSAVEIRLSVPVHVRL